MGEEIKQQGLHYAVPDFIWWLRKLLFDVPVQRHDDIAFLKRFGEIFVHTGFKDAPCANRVMLFSATCSSHR